MKTFAQYLIEVDFGQGAQFGANYDPTDPQTAQLSMSIPQAMQVFGIAGGQITNPGQIQARYKRLLGSGGDPAQIRNAYAVLQRITPSEWPGGMPGRRPTNSDISQAHNQSWQDPSRNFRPGKPTQGDPASPYY